MNRRLAILPVSAELLRQVLHLPDTVRIENVSFDIAFDRILLRVDGPDFPEVPSGDAIPQIDATFRRSDSGAVEFIGWKW